MNIRWYGQSAFLLRGTEHAVFIDPFGKFEWTGTEWNYPPVADVTADLLLVTHDHRDHNAIDVVDGDPVVITKAGVEQHRIR